VHEPTAHPASTGLPFPKVPDVIFANWREAPHRPGLGSGVQTVYSIAISGCLKYCARNGIRVTTASARAYMDEVLRRGLARQPDLWKEGLNWFFRMGRQHTSARDTGALPSLGQADTGAEPWERRLIERLRIQHYAWRTEQTCREWAWRLAQ